MNFQTMNKQRLLLVIFSATGILSMFLTWVSISSFGFNRSINGFHGWGIPLLPAFVAAAIIALAGNQTKRLVKNQWFLVMACGAIALLS